MLYFLYGLISMSLWFWGKVLEQVAGNSKQGTGKKIPPSMLSAVSCFLIDLSSIFEDAQFIGFREVKRGSSWNKI